MSNMEINGVLVSMRKGAGLAGSKVDKVMTVEIENDKDAGEGAGTWSNKLFPPKACGKRNSFTELRKHLNQMYGWHMDNTDQFEDEIWRILNNKRLENYRQVVEIGGRARALELLDAFLDDYENLKDLARSPKPNGRGDLFKESDYPDKGTIRGAFHYDVEYRPIPTGAMMNASIFQEQIEKLNALHQKALVDANARLVKRFMEPFQTLSEQLKDPSKRKLAPVLEKIREFSQIIPSLDLSGNTELLELAQTVSLTFADITPDVLRQDEEMCKFVGSTAEGVVTALNRFGQLGQRKFAA